MEFLLLSLGITAENIISSIVLAGRTGALLFAVTISDCSDAQVGSKMKLFGCLKGKKVMWFDR